MIPLTPILVAVILATTPGITLAVDQKPSGGPGAPKPAGVGACSLLTKAEVKKLTASNDQFFDMAAPREEPILGGGSACFYSGIVIQVDPFSPASFEAHRKKVGGQWQTLSGIGDAAYLHDAKRSASSHFAELYARVGARVVTIQMSVRPPEASVDTVVPRLLPLAKALVAKVR